MTKSIIILILILLLIIIYYYYNISIHFNDSRHLTNSYQYAHFSKINMYNFFLFPNFLLFTHPIYFTLNDNDTLFIPKYWWHWVITPEQTFAFNIWFSSDDLMNQPKQINNFYNNNTNNKIFENIKNIFQNNSVNIYHYKNYDKKYDDFIKENGNEYLQSEKGDSYFFTLDGYFNNDIEKTMNHNDEIKQKLNNIIPTPEILKDKKNIEKNFWISSKYFDTGLHYDNNDGYLHVVKGKKYIVLYPPSDSKFLQPYDTLPNYACNKAIRMNYNAYYLIDENITGLPSERILYE